MHNSRIKNRYARAFLENSVENNKLSKTHDDCVEFLRVCEENRELDLILLNPVIKGSIKCKIIKEIFEKSFDRSTISFIVMVIHHDREVLLKEILKQYNILYKENQEIIEVEVLSVVPLSRDILEKLNKYVKKLTGYKTVELTNSIKDDLIGGFAIKYKDRLLDMSIANKLKLLKQHLAN